VAVGRAGAPVGRPGVATGDLDHDTDASVAHGCSRARDVEEGCNRQEIQCRNGGASGEITKASRGGAGG